MSFSENKFNLTSQEIEFYCNYPEVTKKSKKCNLRTKSITTSSTDLDSSCSSDLSNGISTCSETRLMSPTVEKLSTMETDDSLSLVEISSSALEASESEYYEEESEEKYLVKNIDWSKYSIVTSPWNESKNPMLLWSSIIDQEIDTALTKETIALGSSNIDHLPDKKKFVWTRLQLSHKGLTDISLLSSYPYYQYIDLSWNKITELSAISTLYLMCLDVSHNKLSSVLQFKPPWFLTYVNLSCNEIKEIDDLSEFWSLRHLNLSYNGIVKIQGLKNLKFLRYLNLSHNYIECIEGLSNLTLEELRLEYNHINRFDEVEPGLMSMPKLNKLILSHNQISTLHCFREVHTLQSLDISYNCITDLLELDNLNSLKHLHQLNLFGNEITKWPGYREFVVYILPSLLYLDFIVVEEQEKIASQSLFSPDIMNNGYFTHGKLTLLNNLSTQGNLGHVLPVDQPPFPIVVFVGPPGCYKRTLASKLAAHFPDFVYHCPLYTTQPILQENELDYRAILMDEFNEMVVGGKFLAIANLLGHKYGFCRDELCKSILNNKLCLLCLPLEAAIGLKALSLRPYFILTLLSDSLLHSTKLKIKFQTLHPVIKDNMSENSKDFEFLDSNLITFQELEQKELIRNLRKCSQDTSTIIDELSPLTSSKLTPNSEPLCDNESIQAQNCDSSLNSELRAQKQDEDNLLTLTGQTFFSQNKISLVSPNENKSTCGISGYVHEDSEWSFSLVDYESEPSPEPSIDEAVLAAEISQQHFVETVVNFSHAYSNLHESSPDLFTDKVYTDNLKHAFTKLKNIIHEIYNDHINWKPCFKVEEDPLYKNIVKPKIDFLMTDLLGNKRSCSQ